jgi:hypothetical protein
MAGQTAKRVRPGALAPRRPCGAVGDARVEPSLAETSGKASNRAVSPVLERD